MIYRFLVLMLMTMGMLIQSNQSHAEQVDPLNWIVGPVYLFDDLEKVESQIEMIQAYGINPILLLMPVYDNQDTRTYNDYAVFVKKAYENKVKVIISEPVINKAGSYGKNRSGALKKGIRNLVVMGVQISGIYIQPDYEKDYMILRMQADLPIVIKNVYEATKFENEDIVKNIKLEPYEAVLIPIGFSQTLTKAWLNQLIEIRYPMQYLSNDLQQTEWKQYLENLRSWDVVKSETLDPLQSFLDDQEEQIAGTSVEPSIEVQGLDIGKNVKLILVFFTIITIVLVVVFLINLVISRRKFIKK